ncbi:hypothetical protein D3C76_1630680 [compost metagenome]
MDAASRPTSFNRNCPGTTVMAGKPRAGSNTSGVLSIKVRVVINSPADKIPPTSDNFGDRHLAAISSPIEISRTPRKYENPLMLMKPYIHERRGLWLTNPAIPFASYNVNFIPPNHR